MILKDFVPYKEQPRTWGGGELRLENSIQLGEDIFSLSFCALIKDEVINKHVDIVMGEFWAEGDENQQKIMDAFKLSDDRQPN